MASNGNLAPDADSQYVVPAIGSLDPRDSSLDLSWESLERVLGDDFDAAYPIALAGLARTVTPPAEQ